MAVAATAVAPLANGGFGARGATTPANAWLAAASGDKPAQQRARRQLSAQPGNIKLNSGNR